MVTHPECVNDPLSKQVSLGDRDDCRPEYGRRVTIAHDRFPGCEPSSIEPPPPSGASMGRLYALIEDPPLYGDTLGMWERHLERLEQLAKDADNRALMIAWRRR
jgi:hypothetical protein